MFQRINKQRMNEPQYEYEYMYSECGVTAAAASFAIIPKNMKSQIEKVASHFEMGKCIHSYCDSVLLNIYNIFVNKI